MHLLAMEIFYHVVSRQSFSAAAQQLQVSKSHISKKVTELERELGVKLLNRSTRKLSVTEAGQHFFDYCQQIVKVADSASHMIEELRGDVAGLLKISLPPALAQYVIAPLLPDLLDRYPNLQLQLNAASTTVNIIEEGYDVALRATPLTTSNLIARKLTEIDNVICATPSLLAKYPPLKHPDDLEQIPVFNFGFSDAPKKLCFYQNDVTTTLTINSRVNSNYLELVKRLVLSDQGLAILPSFMVKHELMAKRLVLVLSDYHLAASPLYAVFPQRQFMLPKLRVLLDMLQRSLSAL